MEVFQKRTLDAPGFDLFTVLGLPAKRRTKGEVGLEIEVEGNKFPKPEGYAGTHHPVKMPGLKGWMYVHDGSLRGQDNAEYLFDGPCSFNDVEGRVAALFANLADYGSIIEDSNRTSVHVHLNVQSFHLNRLASFLALYFCFEEILTEWCGEHRVGNLFCLRAKDAPAIVTQARKFIQADGHWRLNDSLHYSAANLHALAKHGSLEFRTLRGVTDPTVIIEWVSILRRLYEVSADYTDPRTVTDGFSGTGPLAFFESIFGDLAETVRRDVPWTAEQFAESLYEGIRLAQDICYCRDWSLYNAMTIRPDPFGRDASKIAKSIKKMVLDPESDAFVQTIPSTASITAASNGLLGGQTVNFVEAEPDDLPDDLDSFDFDEDIE